MTGEVANLDRLTRGLPEVAGKLADLPDDEAAALIARVARVPRRTGKLAASQRLEAHAVLWGARYAVPVHWGVPGRGQRAQPWATDALTAARPELETLYTRAAAAALDSL